MRHMLTFRLSTLLLLMATLAVGLGWWRERTVLQRQIADAALLRRALPQIGTN